jgi:hypothetical protein
VFPLRAQFRGESLGRGDPNSQKHHAGDRVVRFLRVGAAVVLREWQALPGDEPQATGSFRQSRPPAQELGRGRNAGPLVSETRVGSDDVPHVDRAVTVTISNNRRSPWPPRRGDRAGRGPRVDPRPGRWPSWWSTRSRASGGSAPRPVAELVVRAEDHRRRSGRRSYRPRQRGRCRPGGKGRMPCSRRRAALSRPRSVDRPG